MGQYDYHETYDNTFANFKIIRQILLPLEYRKKRNLVIVIVISKAPRNCESSGVQYTIPMSGS
jgi:hypothetical protein